MTMEGIFWKRTILTLALVPITIFCLFAGIYSFSIVRASVANSQILSQYEQKFEQIPHPPNTSIVASKREVSPSTGNGGHCFYFVGEIRSFSGDRSTIEAFYADKQVGLQFFKNQQISTELPRGLKQLSNWRISPTHLDQALYVVYTINTKIDDFNSIDLRC